MNPKSKINDYEATSVFSSDFASFKWKIRNFPLCNLKEGEKFRSPEFYTTNATWVLDIFPKSSAFVGKIAIYLFQIASECKDRTVSYKISLQDKDGKEHYIHESQHVFSGTLSGWAGTSLIDRTYLFDEKKDEFLPDETLTVFCELNAGCNIHHSKVTRISDKDAVPVPVTAKDNPSVVKLIADFERVFEKQKYCDVVLSSSDGVEFPAHKAILEERSSVFAAMFLYDMTETRLGEVHIDDITGDILKHLLYFMYTSKIKERQGCDILDLYTAADKYNIDGLKEACLFHLLDNMSIGNVCDALILADTFREDQLRQVAMSFLCNNTYAVISSNFWKDFRKEHPYLAAEILEIIILNQNS